MKVNQNKSRSQYTKNNLITGAMFKVISVVLPFVIRTAILYELGDQYTGLSSLFNSILRVLNLAELGFSSAVVYNMYKPIADGNTDLVCRILEYYKKAYRIIGSVIFAAGMILMPFVPYLIKGKAYPDDINIYILYFLYLMNTAVSYFLFAYKSALLNALQRMDLVNIVMMIVQTGKYVLQLVVLIVLKNYYLFVIVAIVSSIATNLVTSYVVDKNFPQYKAAGKIPDEIKQDVKKQIGGLMISKLCDTSRNSLDSIILSTLFGLTTVTIYNNYYYIFDAVYGALIIITHAMQASAGNSIAKESVDKNYGDLLKFQFIFSWIMCFCTTCMLCLYQPFMVIWTKGTALLFSVSDMMLFCLYFYILNMNNMRNLYFTGNGLWWHAKISFILEAAGNLILNIVLGKLMGITGVILATIITIFIFNFIVRTQILFREYFKMSPKKFYLENAGYAVITAVTGLGSYYICELIPFDGYIGLILRLGVALVIPNAVMVLLFFRSSYFRYAYKLGLRLIKKKVH